MYCMQSSLSLLHEQIKCMEILDIISSHILSSHCVLSHFSRVQFSATPWTLAHQDPLSMGFSWQENWSGLPFPSLTLFLILLSDVKQKLAKSCPILCDPMDYIVHGIPQARIQEWVAIPFSRGSFQPRSPALQVDSLPSEPPGKPKHARTHARTHAFCSLLYSFKNISWLAPVQ